MDNSDKESNLKKTLQFRTIDDEIHVFGTCETLDCEKMLGRITYFEGNYQYMFWPSKGVALTLQNMLEITDKIKELSK